MKKVLAAILSLVLLLTLACPAFAAEVVLIPSNGIELVEVDIGNEDITDCIVVTTVSQAKEKSSDTTQEERDFLIQVFENLTDRTELLPVNGAYTIIELSHLGFANEGCIQNEEHWDASGTSRKDQLHLEEVDLAIEFHLNFVVHGELMAFHHVDDEWHLVEDLTELEDDRYSFTLEDVCPVVFIDFEGGGGQEQSADITPEDPDSSIEDIESEVFVPSITYKDGLEIVDGDTNMAETADGHSWGPGIVECIEVTTIAQALDKSTDIHQDERNLLLNVFKSIAQGEMTLPVEGDYVVRDLMDISFKFMNCRSIEEHEQKDEQISKDGVTVTLTFDMGVGPEDNVGVFTYVNEQWHPVEDIINHGDGTVTCVFEELCPVAFIVTEPSEEAPAVDAPTEAPQPQEAPSQNLGLWILIAAAFAAGIVVLLIKGKKKA